MISITEYIFYFIIEPFTFFFGLLILIIAFIWDKIKK